MHKERIRIHSGEKKGSELIIENRCWYCIANINVNVNANAKIYFKPYSPVFTEFFLHLRNFGGNIFALRLQFLEFRNHLILVEWFVTVAHFVVWKR